MIEGQTPLIASGKEIVPAGSNRLQRGERAFFYTRFMILRSRAPIPAGFHAVSPCLIALPAQ